MHFLLFCISQNIHHTQLEENAGGKKLETKWRARHLCGSHKADRRAAHPRVPPVSLRPSQDQHRRVEGAAPRPRIPLVSLLPLSSVLSSPVPLRLPQHDGETTPQPLQGLSLLGIVFKSKLTISRLLF